MEHVLALEVWLASVATAAAIGWLIGDAYAARRKLDDNETARDGDLLSTGAAGSSLGSLELDSLFTLTVPPRIGPQPCGLPRQNTLGAKAAIGRPQKMLPLKRSMTFAGMPPISDLRDEARQILNREPVWSAPDISERLAEFMRSADKCSVEVMNNYRRSIEELRLLNLALGYEAHSETTHQRPGQRADTQKQSPQAELPLGHNGPPVQPKRGLVDVSVVNERQPGDELPPATLRDCG